MKLTLRQQLTQFDQVLQTRLFSILEEEWENWTPKRGSWSPF